MQKVTVFASTATLQGHAFDRHIGKKVSPLKGYTKTIWQNKTENLASDRLTDPTPTYKCTRTTRRLIHAICEEAQWINMRTDIRSPNLGQADNRTYELTLF